jgi:integrase
LAALLAAVPDEWRPLFRFLAATGLRISELIGLRWQDLRWHDDGGAHLTVRWQDHRGQLVAVKSARSRRDVPLPPGMAAELWARGRTGPATSVCSCRRLAVRSSATTCTTGCSHPRARRPVWTGRRSTRSGTCAFLAFEAGRNIAQMSAWLGHADPSFTLRTYVHLMDEGLGDATFMDAVVCPSPALPG